MSRPVPKPLPRPPAPVVPRPPTPPPPTPRIPVRPPPPPPPPTRVPIPLPRPPPPAPGVPVRPPPPLVTRPVRHVRTQMAADITKKRQAELATLYLLHWFERIDRFLEQQVEAFQHLRSLVQDTKNLEYANQAGGLGLNTAMLNRIVEDIKRAFRDLAQAVSEIEGINIKEFTDKLRPLVESPFSIRQLEVDLPQKLESVRFRELGLKGLATYEL